ncbi:flagellar hook-associated protein FlgK [Cohaesibacter haloalkalitolerans]|uniref:flagellar hook-associated protein FlgK n=1 Tax=Cohaesibacter haloalkalitolerans TaxID=1162980 RepID=UPI000E6524AE|nr:flagellar hook-associated protein FlgK [Cohaesibacter haloalkalitolerans]
MALTSALSIATSGLKATNRDLEVASSNIANANTPGYTKKVSSREDMVLNGQVTSVVQTDVQRTLDLVAQKQFWTETGATSYSKTINDYLTQVDAMFGQPGDANALDALVNEFATSLQALETSPDDSTTRLQVLNDASVLTRAMNDASETIQALRQDAEFALEDAVQSANDILQNIQKLDQQIQEVSLTSGGSAAGLMDQRDAFVTQLAELMPVRVTQRDNNSIQISTTGGLTLYDAEAVQLDFTAYGTVGPYTEWDSQSNDNQLGSVYLKSNTGELTDITLSGGLGGSRIGALLELRDDLLVEAQAQLDSLADGLADAFGKFDIEGSAVTVGAQDGFDLDLTDLQSGDEFTFTYQDVGTGETNTVTFVRVDSATSLPLGDDVTARNDDTVVGIDFSGGMASVAAQVQTALGGAFTVSNPAGNDLRILDDGAANTVAIQSFDGRATATGLQQTAGALPFFVDAGAGPDIYSGSVDGQVQQTGFSGRIAVNQALFNDPTLLVRHSASTGIADQTRPSELLAALTDTKLTFSYQDGGAPVSMTVDEFARQVISYQSQQAETAQIRYDGQQIVMNNVLSRFEESASVDVDEELARLLELQTAYSANARVMTAVKEMMDALMRV